MAKHEQELADGDLAPGFTYCTIADALALWAVRVLDAWADKKAGRDWRMARRLQDQARMCCLEEAGKTTRRSFGTTPDAARLAAAQALIAEDPTLVVVRLPEVPHG